MGESYIDFVNVDRSLMDSWICRHQLSVERVYMNHAAAQEMRESNRRLLPPGEESRPLVSYAGIPLELDRTFFARLPRGMPAFRLVIKSTP